MNIEARAVCLFCFGSGSVNVGETTIADGCYVKLRQIVWRDVACHVCEGRGSIPVAKCQECDGDKLVWYRRVDGTAGATTCEACRGTGVVPIVSEQEPRV
jgi:DnaJ-class molecular chaperone